MEKTEHKYVKRTQKDCSMSFKLSVVSNKSLDFMGKSKDREGFELQQKVRLLERKNAPFGEGT